MIKTNIKVGKLYRIRQGTACWSETGKIINDPEKESGIVMVLDEPIQKNFNVYLSMFKKRELKKQS